MTEIEAKAYMEDEIRCIQRASYCDRDCAKCALAKEEEPLLEAFGVAIDALEKVQEYKNIGLGNPAEVEQDLLLYKADRVLVNQYSAIGTVEECRVSVEKHHKKIKPLKVHNRFVCPCCTNDRQEVILTEHTKYCFVCGQGFDWSEIKENKYEKH